MIQINLNLIMSTNLPGYNSINFDGYSYIISYYVIPRFNKMALGIRTLDGITTRIIARDTLLPTKGSQVFSTVVDNQSSVEILIVQGERILSEDNKILGMIRLDGIPPAPRGIPQIEVTFNVDYNGILSVTVVNQQTNHQQSTTINANLSQEEVDKMIKDAEANVESDYDIVMLCNVLQDMERAQLSPKKQSESLNKLAMEMQAGKNNAKTLDILFKHAERLGVVIDSSSKRNEASKRKDDNFTVLPVGCQRFGCIM